MKNIKIAVVYHKKYHIDNRLLNDNRFVFIACGNYTDSNMLKDDTKYSNLNQYINEASALYWLYVNQDKLENPTHIGLFHYRRMLDKSKLDALDDNTILVSRNNLNNTTLKYFHWCLSGNSDSLLSNLILSVSNDKMQLAYDEWSKQNALYEKNMFVMPIHYFNDYAKKLENIIDRIVIPSVNENNIPLHTRFYGFCIEWFTAFYIYYLEHYCNANVVCVPLINI